MGILSFLFATKELDAQFKSVYDFKVESLEGGTIDLSKYKGKKILIVNTASKCGFTPQYKGLEELYKKNKGNLVIIGFPANNFLFQEPGKNADIQTFCSYKVANNKFTASILGIIESFNFQPFLVRSNLIFSSFILDKNMVVILAVSFIVKFASLRENSFPRSVKTKK